MRKVSLRAKNWFEIDDELPQKWIEGMKLDPLVYEKSKNKNKTLSPFPGKSV